MGEGGARVSKVGRNLGTRACCQSRSVAGAEIWSQYPGTYRIDPAIAVKAFHRPAAGNEQPLPSDVRPPHILVKTLDYLFHTLLPSQPLHLTHPFLRDRTRSVRQDLTMQNARGRLAIECNERIARYHILALGALREQVTFSESQELEQLRKGSFVLGSAHLQNLMI